MRILGKTLVCLCNSVPEYANLVLFKQTWSWYAHLLSCSSATAKHYSDECLKTCCSFAEMVKHKRWELVTSSSIWTQCQAFSHNGEIKRKVYSSSGPVFRSKSQLKKINQGYTAKKNRKLHKTQRAKRNHWGGKIDVLHLASDITISLFILLLSLKCFFSVL